ncbi:MAG: hypothetical protein EPO51_14095 [Phenylobacterium sp.]|nr:MAG: hypothetical protein EPO51_14095 [Phenylobacterium sp.]
MSTDRPSPLPEKVDAQRPDEGSRPALRLKRRRGRPIARCDPSSVTLRATPSPAGGEGHLFRTSSSLPRR